jgi:hypothetical protein
MNITQRSLSMTLSAVAALVLTLAPLQAEAQGRHGGGGHGQSAYRGGHGGHGAYGAYGGHRGHRGHGGHAFWGPGVLLGGLAVGIGLGSYYASPRYPGYVVVEPPPVYYPVQPLPAAPLPPLPPLTPDPVIYPRNGQSPEQTEADRQDCNRWATTQPAAMADASVFNRATAACMDGRGYTLR